MQGASDQPLGVCTYTHVHIPNIINQLGRPIISYAESLVIGEDPILFG